MARALSDMLATALNVVAAFIFIVAGGVLGWERYHQQSIGNATMGVIFGLLIGFAAAAIFCGTLATLILIENHLRHLRAEAAETRRARKA
jgi:TRAP-type C4-dicarboxylate transport system permease small subunit